MTIPLGSTALSVTKRVERGSLGENLTSSWMNQHVRDATTRLGALKQHDVAKEVTEEVSRRHVIDAVCDLHHVAGAEAGSSMTSARSS